MSPNLTLQVHNLRLGLGRAYLVEFPQGLLLIDSGSPHQEGKVLQLMQQLGRNDLRLIFITHAHLDHYGSAAALRRITGAPVAIHRADAEAMANAQTPIGQARSFGRLVSGLLPYYEAFVGPEGVSADILLEDGDDLGIPGLEACVLHTPGHTPGSSSLLLQESAAFAGDLVLTTGRPHAQQLYAQDWALISRSLAQLKAAHPQWVYPGHGSYPLPEAGLQKLEVHLQ